MAYNVVFSYSSKNLHVVDWARKTLTQPNITHVFAAEYSVRPGQELNKEIERAIRTCDLFVLLWSHDAHSSEYVPTEIGIAIGCNKPILPVVMEANVPIPPFIANLKYLPAHKDWEGSFKWLRQFIIENSQKLQDIKALGAIAAIIVGGILLSSVSFAPETARPSRSRGGSKRKRVRPGSRARKK